MTESNTIFKSQDVNLEDYVNVYNDIPKKNIIFKDFVSDEKLTLLSLSTFEKNFDKYTNNFFLCMDWSNMVIAGGAVLALLTNENITDDDFGDFDIFLYGLTERQYNKKLVEIYNAFKQISDDILCVRTKRAITFICTGQRHMQIIIKSHDNVNDIFSNFDIDCCCLAYNGEHVLMNERSIKAIATKINTTDLTLSSRSYEYRLAKYGKRGYAVYVDNLEYEKINCQIYSKNVTYSTGLAKLLILFLTI